MDNNINTIVVIARQTDWLSALKSGEYRQSTIDSTLEEVGFIHCSTPDQTIEIANRKYLDNSDLILLFIDLGKVKSQVKFEGARSGRAGIFPHIYGPLNVDAVYSTMPLVKNERGIFPDF